MTLAEQHIRQTVANYLEMFDREGHMLKWEAQQALQEIRNRFAAGGEMTALDAFWLCTLVSERDRRRLSELFGRLG